MMRKIQRPVIIVLFSILLIAAVGSSLYFYSKYQSLSKQSNTKEDTAVTLAAVGKLMMLPEGETPTVASVADAEKLRDQPFFTGAMNGDKVLLYTEAKKAILYRPSTNKIVDVAPITVNATASASSAAQPISFVLYNGTNVTGFTKTYEATLKGLIKNAVVSDRSNAQKRDYETSILIDIAGTKQATATELASVLGMDVGVLPEGETKPTGADFLIILGEDKK